MAGSATRSGAGLNEGGVGGQRRAVLPIRVGVRMAGITVAQMLGVDGRP